MGTARYIIHHRRYSPWRSSLRCFEVVFDMDILDTLKHLRIRRELFHQENLDFGPQFCKLVKHMYMHVSSCSKHLALCILTIRVGSRKNVSTIFIDYLFVFIGAVFVALRSEEPDLIP